MSDIDWSKAPEGFNCWIKSVAPGGSGAFYEHLVESECFRDFEGVIYWTDKDIQNGLAELTIRPAKQEWNGEGLPPVGTVCNIRWPQRTDCNCEITYIGEGVGAYKFKHPDGEIKEYTFSTCSVGFIPVLTEEEKYDDALNSAARDCCGRIGIGEISVVAFKAGAQWQKKYKQPYPLFQSGISQRVPFKLF